MLRVYSWIFQAILCLMAIAVATAALVTGSGGLDIPWILFPTPQTTWLIGIGFVGLVCVLLAIKGTWRILLFLFAIHSLYMLVKGLFLSPAYSFAGPDDFRNAVILAIGAFFAVVGAWPVGPKHRR